MPDDEECERCGQPATVTVEYSDPDEDVDYCLDCAAWAQQAFADAVETVDYGGDETPTRTVYGGP